MITCVVCWIIAFFLFKLANTHDTQTIGSLAGIIGLGFVLLPFNDITDTKARREKSEQKRRNDNAQCILDNLER